jgi:hypothetical protein
MFTLCLLCLWFRCAKARKEAREASDLDSFTFNPKDDETLNTSGIGSGEDDSKKFKAKKKKISSFVDFDESVISSVKETTLTTDTSMMESEIPMKRSHQAISDRKKQHFFN